MSVVVVLLVLTVGCFAATLWLAHEFAKSDPNVVFRWRDLLSDNYPRPKSRKQLLIETALLGASCLGSAAMLIRVLLNYFAAPS